MRPAGNQPLLGMAMLMVLAAAGAAHAQNDDVQYTTRSEEHTSELQSH